MGKIQRVIYVQSGLPPKENENDSLSNRHDTVRVFGICRDGCIVRYVCDLRLQKLGLILTCPRLDYVDQQDGISVRTGGRATVLNDDIVGIFSYNIFVGIAVATIFGSGFFFDLFWPERKESKSVRLAWKICSVVVSIMALADALALTVSVIMCEYYPRSD